MTLKEKMEAAAQQPTGIDLIMGGFPSAHAQERVVQLPIERLRAKANHTFQVREDTEYFQALRESIRANGIEQPLLVRPHPSVMGDYEIVAGHTRRTIAALEDIKLLPCIIKPMSDAEADKLMGETNIQRPDWLPSERARTFAVWLEAVKKESGVHAGRPAMENSGTGFPNLNDVSPNLRNREIAASKWGLSGKVFERYLTLNRLIPALLLMVDEGGIPVKAGYQLSFLPQDDQRTLLRYLEPREIKRVSEAQALEIRNSGVDALPEIFGVKRKEPSWSIRLPLDLFASKEDAKHYKKDPEFRRAMQEWVKAYISQSHADL